MNCNDEPLNLSLLTDFYELTMMQGYFFKRVKQEAVFEVFFRKQPFNGGYAVFAGLKPLLEAIEILRFTDDDLDYLKGLNTFKEEFLDYLKDFRFTGDIFSVPEGSVVFPNQPLVRIHGTLMETQVLESLVLNHINFQTLIATKTCRIVCTADGDPVLDFGLRRAQGVDGSLSATRAAYIGGASSTSNTLAGKTLGIPVSGTMAHSWIMSFPTEIEAFRAYCDIYPDSSVLLVDTFDTLKSGIPNAITVFKEIRDKDPQLMAIRIDSGDLEYLSKTARIMLDDNRLHDVKIFVSSDLDEWIINQLKISGAPINAWGVGTRLVTGWSDPALTGVYKIVAKKNGDKFEPSIKISDQSEKITNPGIKNIMRFYDDRGEMLADLLYLEEERDSIVERIRNSEKIRFNHPATEYEGFTMKKYSRADALLAPVMNKGKISAPLPSLEEIRERREREINSLDPTYKRLLNPHIYKVSLSDRLKTLKSSMIEKILREYKF